MSVVIETVVFCDECGDQCYGDDRCYTAASIRRSRKLAGWIQRGSRDYCGVCVAKLSRSVPPSAPTAGENQRS